MCYQLTVYMTAMLGKMSVMNGCQKEGLRIKLRKSVNLVSIWGTPYPKRIVSHGNFISSLHFMTNTQATPAKPCYQGKKPLISEVPYEVPYLETFLVPPNPWGVVVAFPGLVQQCWQGVGDISYD